MSAQVKPEIARQASQWMARLWAEDASVEDRQACQHWREAALEHERAWQLLQQLQGRFDSLGRGAGSRVLARSVVSRRQLLAFGGLALGGAAVLGLPRTATWQEALADQRTAAGQVRGLLLGDGSRLYLNTRTRLDLQEQAGQQYLHLYEGELLLDMTTRHANRACRLSTADGTLIPNMARLSLRCTDGISRIALYQGDAEWQTHSGQRIGLQAGQTLVFGNDRQLASEPALVSDTAWLQGKLVAERMPLDRFIAELGRYRPGLLRGDPALARLQVTGVFSVADTDLALEQLTRILPVRVSRVTRYWVQVSPA